MIRVYFFRASSRYREFAEAVSRGRSLELSPEDDVEGVGICVRGENLFIAADREGTEGECVLQMVEWGKPARLSDDQ